MIKNDKQVVDAQRLFRHIAGEVEQRVLVAPAQIEIAREQKRQGDPDGRADHRLADMDDVSLPAEDAQVEGNEQRNEDIEQKPIR